MSNQSELEARFELLEKLGEGASGTAYRARQRGLDRAVVVKVLHASDDDARRRFVREARTLARLRHPGIAELVDFGATPECTYLATIDYQARCLLIDRAWEPDAALAFLASVADALAHVHSEGLIHRDLKPANILVGAGGQPILIDFGLCYDTDATRLTATGDLMATPTHVAPELLRGERVGSAADLYALGVIACELLTGSNPFWTGGVPETLGRHLNHRIEDWYGPSSVPPAVRATLLGLLEKDPLDRPPSAAAVRDALRTALAASAFATMSSAVAGAPSSAITGAPDGAPTGRPPAGGQVATAVLAPATSDAARSAAGAGATPPRPLPTRSHEDARAIARRTKHARRAMRVRWLAAVSTLTLVGVALLALVRPEARGPGPAVGASARAGADGAQRTAAGAVRSFALLASDDRVQIAVAHTFAVPLTIELAAPTGWRAAGTAPAGDGSVRTVFDLPPDTAGAVRLTVDGREVVARYPFRTAPASVGATIKAVQAIAFIVFEQRKRMIASIMETYPPDARVATSLVEALKTGGRHGGVIAEIARWNQTVRSAPLASTLLESTAPLEEQERVEVLASCVASYHPRARELALAALPGLAKPQNADRLLLALSSAGLTLPFEALVAHAEHRPVGAVRALGQLLAWSDPDRALAKATWWLTAADPLDCPEIAPFVLLALADDPAHREAAVATAKTLARRPEPHVEVLRLLSLLAPPGACEALAPLGSSGAAFAARALLACADGADHLEATARSDGDRVAQLLALSVLGRAGRPDALRTYLAGSDGVAADVAAWSVAQASLRALTPALLARVRSDRDAHGVALWALARLGAPEADPLILAALGSRDDACLGLAASAAGERGLSAAVPRLEGLAAERSRPAFVRACARDALRWIGGAPRGHTLLLPPFVCAATTGLQLSAGSSYEISAQELPVGGGLDTRVPLDLFRVREPEDRALNRTFPHAGIHAGGGQWPVTDRPQRRFFAQGGPLSVFARVDPVRPRALPGAFLRIVLDP